MKNKFNPWDPGPELLNLNVNPRMQDNSYPKRRANQFDIASHEIAQ